jgi:uncharacterized repeat protein (TIGR01451 family)
MDVRISRVILSAALLGLLAGFSVAAQAANGSVKVTSIVQAEVQVLGKDGKMHTERHSLSKAAPGATVLFVNTFENVSSKPATDIVINNPISANVEYQAGSAYGESTEITFSVDGGKTFAAPEKLTIKTGDGYEKTASTAAYTNIRWTYKNQLAPNVTGEVGFRAVIK